jgi:hypothetical protein
MSDLDKTLDDETLDGFFDAARAQAPPPSDALLARIDASASREAIIPAAPATSTAPAVRGFFAALGGWPVMAGLATAAIAGVWIGYSSPSLAGLGVEDPVDGFDLGGLLPGYVAVDEWSS